MARINRKKVKVLGVYTPATIVKKQRKEAVLHYYDPQQPMVTKKKQAPPDEEAVDIMKEAVGSLYNSDRKEPQVLKACLLYTSPSPRDS